MKPTTLDELVAAFRDTPGRVRLIGGGTTARPCEGATTLALDGLTGVLAVRPADLMATIRTGTRLTEVDAALREHDRRLAIHPFDDGHGTLGGACVAGADGLRARFGFRMRDQVLAATAVLPTGDVVRVGAAVLKSVAGFDVARVFVGAGGTLAALVEITVRVEAVPTAEATVGASFEALADAIDRARGEARGPHAPSAVAVRSRDGAHDLRVLFEGGPAAVRAALARARSHGLDEVEPPWQAWTAEAAAPTSAELVRVVAPDVARPSGAPFLLVDVLRSRYVAHVPPPQPAPRAHPLLARLRAAFDPESRLVGGPR